jgi:hypothetical protein
MQMPAIVLRILRPPGPGASKEERLRFVRRCALFALAPVSLVWIDAIAFGYWPTWLLVVVSVGTGSSLLNIASLSWRIRRIARAHD